MDLSNSGEYITLHAPLHVYSTECCTCKMQFILLAVLDVDGQQDYMCQMPVFCPYCGQEMRVGDC